jgi:hypothetical protein
MIGHGRPDRESWGNKWPETAFMLTHLANLVASGTKTCSGFKKVHLNACAKAVNEKFRTMKTGEQVKNHLKT